MKIKYLYCQFNPFLAISSPGKNARAAAAKDRVATNTDFSPHHYICAFIGGSVEAGSFEAQFAGSRLVERLGGGCPEDVFGSVEQSAG